LAGATPLQWTGIGANDHWYELVSQAGINYQDAKAAASGMSYLGIQGHLVTWSTQAEYVFTLGASLVNNAPGYWFGAERADELGTPTQNWVWVNGEGAVPTSFTNTWNIDFFEGPGAYAIFSFAG